MYRCKVTEGIVEMVNFLNTEHIPKVDILYLGHKDGRWTVVYLVKEVEDGRWE